MEFIEIYYQTIVGLNNIEGGETVAGLLSWLPEVPSMIKRVWSQLSLDIADALLCLFAQGNLCVNSSKSSIIGGSYCLMLSDVAKWKAILIDECVGVFFVEGYPLSDAIGNRLDNFYCAKLQINGAYSHKYKISSGVRRRLQPLLSQVYSEGLQL